MATRKRLRAAVRWAFVGRRDGLRAGLRRRLGLFEWLDDGQPVASETPEGASAPPETEALPSPDLSGWVAVLAADELLDGEVVEAMATGRPVALARVGDVFHALDNVCPHAGGPLGDGILEGCTLTCPWHGWAFDVTTGLCEVDDTLQVERIDVRVVDGQVYLRESA